MNWDKIQKRIERCMIPVISVIGIYFMVMLAIAVINFINPGAVTW